MNQSWPVEIAAIYIFLGHDFKGRFGQSRLHSNIQTVESVQCVAGKGLVGDRYFDFRENFKGQVTFFDGAVYDDLRKHFDKPDLTPSVFRRNIILRGLDLNGLIGREFEIQDIRFHGTQEAAPCSWMDEAAAPGAEQFLKGRGGLRVRILSDGELRSGTTTLTISENS